MKKTYLLFCIFLCLFFVPTLFRDSGFYSVGGDDTLLYYLFPSEMIHNYIFNIISDNVLSALGVYGQQWYMFPFYFLISVVKVALPIFNTQMLFYGANLAFGFIAIYLLVGLLIDSKYNQDFFVRTAAGLFYVFSTFTFYTLWSTQLFAVYLVSIFPLVLYLFLRGIKEKKCTYLIIGSILLSLFSIVLLSFPWWGALFLSILPLLYLYFSQYKKRFIFSIFIFFIVTALLNFYWIFHLVYSPLSSDKLSSDIISHISSVEFRGASENLIRDVSRFNDVLYPFIGLFHKNIQEKFNWQSYDIYSEWHLKFLVFDFLFFAIVVAPLFYIKRIKKKLLSLYVALFFSWLIIIFLFTANIGSWGVNVFVWLSDNIPGFVMFKNMFDKFGIAMAFSYALLLGVSMKIVSDMISKETIKRIGMFFIIVLIFINAKPFIFGEYYKYPIWTTKQTYNTISDFNQDFYNLVDYIKNIDDPSRALWLPLNNANYIQVSDKNLPDHYYSGVSPLQFLANVNDFNGYLSFPSPYNDNLFDAIRERDYQIVGDILQRFNVDYIIINDDISEDLQQSYLYGKELYDSQMSTELIPFLIGNKVQDFGGRYSLYEINDRFKSEKIYLTENLDEFPIDSSQVGYKKVASYEYKVQIKNLSDLEYIVFLDPYHKQWEWYGSNNEAAPVIFGPHDTVFEYANAWTIDPEYIKQNFPQGAYHENPDGSIDVDLTLYFKPQSYFYLGLIVSGVTLAGCLGCLSYVGIMKIRNKKFEKVKDK